MTVPLIWLPDLSLGAVFQVPFCLISTWYAVARSPISIGSRMLRMLNVTDEGGSTSSLPVVFPVAAAQYVQTLSSTALLPSKPAALQVESAVDGCPLRTSVSDVYQLPNCCNSVTSFASNAPVLLGGTLKMRVVFIPTLVK